MNPEAKFIKQKSKGRYFYFRGDRKTRKANFRQIEHLVKPYPKREGEGNGEQVH